jgi:ankyrin repeat protein
MRKGLDRLGNRFILATLMFGGPMTGVVTASGDIALVGAVKNTDINALRELLEDGADVNTRQPDGATALHWAVHRGNQEMVQLLTAAGADLNARNELGVSPISVACANGEGVIVKILVDAGADAHAALGTGESALMTCSRTGSREGVQALLDQGADANAMESEKNQTALMWAVSQKHPEVARLLIKYGANIGTRSRGGSTPMMFAARVGAVDSARVLLDAGADVNEAIAVESTYNPPNPYELGGNDAPDAANALAQAIQAASIQPNPEAEKEKTMTPLLMAAASGHEEMAIFLLSRGGDPHARDPHGATALHYAILEGIASMSGVSLANYVSHLFRPNMQKLVKELLARGADPDARIEGAVPVAGRGAKAATGATAFLLAAASADTYTMRMLSENGANPLLATEENTTALLAAAGVGRVQDFTESEKVMALEAVKLAVALGAEVNAVNEMQRGALHGASNLGGDPIIEFLVGKGANLDVKDIYQQTPLSIAAGVHLPWTPKGDELGEVVRPETTELLLRLGATPLDTPGYFTPVEEGSDAYRMNPRRTVPGITIPD